MATLFVVSELHGTHTVQRWNILQPFFCKWPAFVPCKIWTVVFFTTRTFDSTLLGGAIVNWVSMIAFLCIFLCEHKHKNTHTHTHIQSFNTSNKNPHSKMINAKRNLNRVRLCTYLECDQYKFRLARSIQQTNNRWRWWRSHAFHTTNVDVLAITIRCSLSGLSFILHRL